MSRRILYNFFGMNEEGNFPGIIISTIPKSHLVVQLVEALRYKPEGRGFDSPWFNWCFSLT